MRQRIDLDVTAQITGCLRAGQRVATGYIHRTGTADAFAARPAESQRRVDFILDFDKRIKNHRATTVHVYFVSIETRVFTAVRIVAVDLEAPCVDCASGCGKMYYG